MRLTVNLDTTTTTAKTRQALLDDLAHHLRTEILGALDLGVHLGDGWEVDFFDPKRL